MPLRQEKDGIIKGIMQDNLMKRLVQILWARLREIQERWGSAPGQVVVRNLKGLGKELLLQLGGRERERDL